MKLKIPIHKKYFLLVFFTGIIYVTGLSQPGKLQKPNVIFILADDLGYSDLGCTGSKFYETPNIDKLAQQSVQFNKAYAACQVCSPSRASILTGVYPPTHGITDYLGAPTGEEWRRQNRFTKLLPAAYQHQLALEYTTIPELLKQNGYSTFFAGKWHLGPEGFYPQQQGFDFNKGGSKAGGTSAFFSPFKLNGLTDSTVGESLEMRLANETVAFIRQNREQPFFAMLSFYAVHAPLQTTVAKWNYFRNKAAQQGIKDSGFKMERRLPVRQQQDNPLYAGLISSMDDAVGKLMDAVKELNLDNNTIVIFTSDNGGVVSGDAYATNLFPLRGGKGYQWEGGLRVPLFMKVPGVTSIFTNTPVHGIDFLPTILELTNTKTKPAQQIAGVSLVPLLQHKKIADRALYWHYPHYGNQGGDPSSVIHSGKWKLIHYWENSEEELYNLEKDISEQTNVAAANAAVVKKLSNQLQQWLQQTNAIIPAKDTAYDEGKEYQYKQKVKTEIWSNQEQHRKNQLDKNFKPNKDWWGSQAKQ